MSDESILFNKYLRHLAVPAETPTITNLCRLQSEHIKKFPFENVSKIIFNYEQGLNKLIDFQSHIDNSVKFGFGGTCYACNYYFNKLLKHLGYNTAVYGADMKSGKDVHLVNKIFFGNEVYLVDVGYGAPFYKPIQLNKLTNTIKWGQLEYKITSGENDVVRVAVYKNDENVHEYRVNNEPGKIDRFRNIIEESYDDDKEFMKTLRIIRYFDDYSIELKNFEYTINRDNSSTKFRVSNIEDLEEVVESQFQLPNLPVRRAYEILRMKNYFAKT